jgi:hypothetical protein
MTTTQKLDLSQLIDSYERITGTCYDHEKPRLMIHDLEIITENSKEKIKKLSNEIKEVRQIINQLDSVE